MTKKLVNKVAVVTGASKGIGASIAKHLAAEGASVIVNYSSSEQDANHVVKEIEAQQGKALAVQANVGNLQEVQKLFEVTLKAFGKVDIVINNAGIYEFNPLEKVTAENFYKIFNINVLGLILVSQEAVKHFGDKGGSIVNISSVASVSGLPHTTVYGASKAAVDEITKVLAKELGPRGIRVNSVNPGMVETEGTHQAGFVKSDFQTKTEEHTPLGRIGQPKDIAPAVVFLSSDEASWITGESLFISGGYR